MVGNFFKNASYTSLGFFSQIFIAIVSSLIYIRYIGTSGYALLGIVFSLILLVLKLDIPYSLSLLKHNADYCGKDKNLFQNAFNSLYKSVLLGNIILFIFLSPLVIFLSSYVYGDKNLIPFYFMAIFILLFLRTNKFLRDFLRTNKYEILVQKATIPNLTFDFLTTLVFLFIFDFGVLSIFFGSFIGNVLEYFLLTHYTKTLINYSPYFSLKLIKRIFREHTFKNYMSRSLNGLIFTMGFLISTLYLDTNSLGILAVFISIVYKLQDIFYQLLFHISPIYSYQILKNNYHKIEEVIRNFTALSLAFFIIFSIFLSVIGKEIYYIYFGSNLYGTYFLFLLIGLGTLFYLSFLPVENYLFVSDIKIYNNILGSLNLIFFALLFPLLHFYGLTGVVTAYFIVNLLRVVIFLYYTNKKMVNLFDNDLFAFFAVALVAIIMTLLIHLNNQSSLLLISAISMTISLFLFINMKKLINVVKYVCFEV
ncbi:hypothetical protein HYU09_02715 [Candidatus Woesearchaeota archaeon]|nr:hypothetical protein [Candidatus Woesearchaeota archaeon]